MKQSREMQVLGDIAAQMEALPGHVGFYYKNLATGLTFGVGAEECYLAASVIKLPLYLHILAQCHEGRMRMDDRLTITAGEKMPSCGALTLFTGDVTADLRTLCRLMIVISDNTATNVLIRHVTMTGAQEGFRRMGLEKTQLRRLLFDSEASRAGIQNEICPREMGMLLEKLYRGEYLTPEISREAMDTLLLQQVDHKLNGKICGEIPIAHKTGEDDQLSNDVGIVFAREPFVICFAGHDTDVYAWEDLMRRGAYELWKAQEE